MTAALSNRDAVVLAAGLAERSGFAYRGFAGDYARLLVEHGNADGSEFWAPQTAMAERLAWSVDKVRKVLRVARRVGLLLVHWSKPARGPDGRWYRRRVNRYMPAWRRARGSLKAKRLAAPTVTRSTVIPQGSNTPSLNAFRQRPQTVDNRPPGMPSGPRTGPQWAECQSCTRWAWQQCALADVTDCQRGGE